MKYELYEKSPKTLAELFNLLPSNVLKCSEFKNALELFTEDLFKQTTTIKNLCYTKFSSECVNKFLSKYPDIVEYAIAYKLVKISETPPILHIEQGDNVSNLFFIKDLSLEEGSNTILVLNTKTGTIHRCRGVAKNGCWNVTANGTVYLGSIY